MTGGLRLPLSLARRRCRANRLGSARDDGVVQVRLEPNEVSKPRGGTLAADLDFMSGATVLRHPAVAPGEAAMIWSAPFGQAPRGMRGRGAADVWNPQYDRCAAGRQLPSLLRRSCRP